HRPNSPSSGRASSDPSPCLTLWCIPRAELTRDVPTRCADPSTRATPGNVTLVEKRRLGGSGLQVSRIALGTMMWGRDADEHEAHDQLTAFVRAGGTLVDTAASYGDGASEALIGRLLGNAVSRADVVLATKAGVVRRNGEGRIDVSRKCLLDQLDESLDRLDVAHVDLWQVHAWSDAVPLDETLAAWGYAV